MTKNSNGNIKLAKMLVPIIAGLVLSLTLGLSKWTVNKTVDLDKEVSTMKVVNVSEHAAFEKADEAMLREQRAMSRKIDRVDRMVIKIGAKLDVDHTP